MEVKFTIYGPPKGKGRPRVTSRGTHTPDDTVVYENQVKTEYRQQCGLFQFEQKKSLEVRIFAFYPIPQSKSKKKKEQMKAGLIRPTIKPDLDNIVKVVCDSLNHIAFYDDSQIVDCMCRKFYSENPRVEVRIREAATVKLNV